MYRDDVQGNQLIFYLKFENSVENISNEGNENMNSSTLSKFQAFPNSINQSRLKEDASLSLNSARNLSGTNVINEGILTIYYIMKANGNTIHQDIQIKSLNIGKTPLIKLHTLNQYEISQYSTRENEFVVNLNLEYTYSLILIHMTKNIEKYYNNKEINSLPRDDVCVILRSLPESTFSQDYGLSIGTSWRKR